MKKQNRILALLLCLAMLLPACAKDEPEQKDPANESKQETPAVSEETPDESEAETPAETEPTPQAPAQDFGGATFKVVYRGESSYVPDDIHAEDIIGELINDIVYERNTALEDQLKFKFEFVPQTGASHFIRTDVGAGGGNGDVVFDSLKSLASVGPENALYNWKKLTYIDGTTPWWDTNSFDMTIANRLYMVNSDISVNITSRARFLYFNKAIMEENNLGNPYELVENNAWTWDAFANMVTAISEDLDGNGIMDGYDRFGLLWETPSFFWTGCGVLMTEKAEGDIPVMNCVNERTVDVLAKIKALADSKDHVISFEKASAGMDMSAFSGMSNFCRSLFAAGQFLFVQNGANVANQFSEMKDPYGLLPNPKYDEAQQEYYHVVDSNSCAWGISSMASDLTMVEVILDHWAYNSGELIDAFYETTMKGRRLDAPDDAKILDLVRATTRYEIANLYGIGISSLMDAAYKSGDLMSTYRSQGRTLEKQLSRLVSKFPAEE